MANLGNGESNRFERAFAEGFTEGEAAEIRKEANSLRKLYAALEKRQTEDEKSILETVRAIGKRLTALEAAAKIKPHPLADTPGWNSAAADVEANLARMKR